MCWCLLFSHTDIGSRCSITTYVGRLFFPPLNCLELLFKSNWWYMCQSINRLFYSVALYVYPSINTILLIPIALWTLKSGNVSSPNLSLFLKSLFLLLFYVSLILIQMFSPAPFLPSATRVDPESSLISSKTQNLFPRHLDLQHFYFIYGKFEFLSK